jgi:glutathione S-transferase
MTPTTARARNLPQVKVPLLPTFYFTDVAGSVSAVTDSSPIIRQLEREWPERSIIPPDPAAAFIDMLLEDYGDEWLTKAMFHYRWSYAADIKRGGDVLPLWRGLSRSNDEIAKESRAITERQIARLRFVGSNATTAPVIEESYRRLLGLIDDHLRAQPYLFGSRPGSSDFAFYGQLTQLAQFDPTPMALTLELAPRVYAWSTLMEDLSGEEPSPSDWLTGNSVPETLEAILREVGRTYVPVMLANARALGFGAKEVEATIDGLAWVQAPFPYQRKCLQWLREAYAALPEEHRRRVDPLLATSGCAALVAA